VCDLFLLAEKGENSSRTSTAKRLLQLLLLLLLLLLLHGVRTCTGRYHIMLLSEDYPGRL
jgi:hypothetical protein